MVQYVAAVLRVMAAFAEDPDLGRLVRVAVQHENAQIAFAAYCACKEVGWKTSPDPIDRFAADSSTRLDLFEELQRSGEEDQFPRAYWTQSSFAEGDMVRWLMRSITFARPPQSIKLVETRIVSPMGKKGRIYVYKFKYPWKERGWIIGLSGPQPLNSSEMVTAGTGTSSAGRSERDTSIEELLEFLEEEMLRKPVELKRSEAKSHR